MEFEDTNDSHSKRFIGCSAVRIMWKLKLSSLPCKVIKSTTYTHCVQLVCPRDEVPSLITTIVSSVYSASDSRKTCTNNAAMHNNNISIEYHRPSSTFYSRYTFATCTAGGMNCCTTSSSSSPPYDLTEASLGQEAAYSK